MSEVLKRLSFLIVLLVGLGGCVHQEMTLPTFQNGTSVNDTPKGGSVDVSDLNVSPTSEGGMTVVPRIPFPQEEYSRLARVGQGTVKGTIFIEDSYGGRVYGKQTRLYLNPVTSYSKQWYEESYLGGKKMAKADQRLFNYLRFTASDKDGHFAFYGVPPGRYYVIGVVRCGSECGYDSVRNIRVAKEISVANAETVQVELSKRLEPAGSSTPMPSIE